MPLGPYRLAQVWAQACSNDVTVPDFTLHGWSLKDGSISVIWDTDDNIKKMDSNQKMLRQGCKCKVVQTIGGKCTKEGRMFSIFCLCKNCKNRLVPESGTATTPHASEAETVDADEDFSDDSSSYSDEDVGHEDINALNVHEMLYDVTCYAFLFLIQQILLVAEQAL